MPSSASWTSLLVMVVMLVAPAAAQDHGRKLLQGMSYDDVCNPSVKDGKAFRLAYIKRNKQNFGNLAMLRVLDDNFDDDYAMFTVSRAVKCLSAVKLNYTLAYEHVTTLVQFFKEYYAYFDMARNPPASPYSNLNPPGFDFKIYNESHVDLDLELMALADSWPAGEDVSTLSIMSGINAAFNKLRDSHVTPDTGSTFGRLSDMFVSIWDSVSYSLSNPMRPLELVNSEGGDPIWKLGDKVIATIDGKSPMEWARTITDDATLLGLNLKNPGSRMNSFLNDLMFGWSIGQIGDLEKLSGVTYQVEYIDGDKGLWFWSALLPGSFANLSLNEIKEDAGAAGPLYLAIQAAIGLYDGELPAAASSDDSAARPARMMQQVPKMRGAIVDEKGKIVGSWGIFSNPSDRKKFGVWKIESMSVPLENYGTSWADLVMACLVEGVDQLIIDVVSNGGGNIDTGNMAPVLLYPDLVSEDNPDTQFLDFYDRRIGPAYEHMISIGALPGRGGGVADKINAFLSNEDAIIERFNYLDANPDMVQQLLGQSVRLFEAITLIYETPQDYTEICVDPDSQRTVSCRKQFFDFAADVQSRLDAIDEEAQGSFVLDTFVLALGAFVNGTKLFNPVQLLQATTPEGDRTNIYLKQESRVRGGVLGNYTQQFHQYNRRQMRENLDVFTAYMADQLSNLDNVTDLIPGFDKDTYKYASPFKKIIAISDGLCGSACTNMQTASLHSRAHPEVAPFRTLTFGGTGKADEVDPFVFPGGNVITSDYNSQAWAYTGFLNTLAAWIGDEELIDTVATIADVLPNFPAFNKQPPRYTAADKYKGTLGPASAPIEYQNVGPDFYLKKWYVGPNPYGQRANLQELYLDAYPYFEKM